MRHRCAPALTSLSGNYRQTVGLPEGCRTARSGAQGGIDGCAKVNGEHEEQESIDYARLQAIEAHASFFRRVFGEEFLI